MAGVDEDERPIEDDDPRVKRIVRRMRIFVAISTAVMAIGFFTVISVIIWRLVKTDELPADTQTGTIREWTVPAGSRIIATAADGGRVFVTAEDDAGRRTVHVLEAGTLRPVGRIGEGATSPATPGAPASPEP